MRRDDVASSPDLNLVDRALLSDGFKAAVRRALEKRPDFAQTGGPRPGPHEVRSFENTSFVMRIGGHEARILVSRGKRFGLLRRRRITYWTFLAEHQGSHLFPICSHAHIDDAAAMLTILFTELSKQL